MSDSEEETPQVKPKFSADTILTYFKNNIDEIKKPVSLSKFTEEEVPILEPQGDVRLEQITPSQNKENWTDSRKESKVSDRKGSFKKSRKGSYAVGNNLELQSSRKTSQAVGTQKK